MTGLISHLSHWSRYNQRQPCRKNYIADGSTITFTIGFPRPNENDFHAWDAQNTVKSEMNKNFFLFSSSAIMDKTIYLRQNVKYNDSIDLSGSWGLFYSDLCHSQNLLYHSCTIFSDIWCSPKAADILWRILRFLTPNYQKRIKFICLSLLASISNAGWMLYSPTKKKKTTVST